LPIPLPPNALPKTARQQTIDIGGVGILAIADFFMQRWRFEQSIKQTKAEVKQDIKAQEGNPAIKSKIRSLQRDSARRT
jgi:flagellar biosynthesis protein FlhB